LENDLADKLSEYRHANKPRRGRGKYNPCHKSNYANESVFRAKGLES